MKNIPQLNIERHGDQERGDDDVKHKCRLLIGSKMQGKSTFMRDEIVEWEALANHQWEGSGIKYRIHNKSGSRAFQEFPRIEEIYPTIQRHYIERGEAYAKKVKNFGALIKGHPMNLVFARDEKDKEIWVQGGMQCQFKSEADIDYMYTVLEEFFRDGAIVFDECSTYIESNPKTLHNNPIIEHRNYGWDIIMAFHRLLDVPNKFMRSNHVDSLYLFKTGEGEIKESELSKKYSDHKLILSEYRRISKTPATNLRVQPYALIEI